MDKNVAIQKLLYPKEPAMIKDHQDSLNDFKFVIKQTQLNANNNATVGAQLVTSWDEIVSLKPQAILRRNSSTPENPSILDKFDCLQRNPDYINSGAKYYFQTCNFTAVKGQVCHYWPDVVSKVVGIVFISCLVMVLTIAVTLIYCLKRKRYPRENLFQTVLRRNYHSTGQTSRSFDCGPETNNTSAGMTYNNFSIPGFGFNSAHRVDQRVGH